MPLHRSVLVVTTESKPALLDSPRERSERVDDAVSRAADAPRAYGMLFDDQSWQEVLHDGTPIRIRPAGEMQPQAYLTRHGTFVYFKSEGLTIDELAAIAASLRPAPETDDA